MHSKKSEQQSIECVFLTCSVEIFVFSSLLIANSLLINRAETLAPWIDIPTVTLPVFKIPGEEGRESDFLELILVEIQGVCH